MERKKCKQKAAPSFFRPGEMDFHTVASTRYPCLHFNILAFSISTYWPLFFAGGVRVGVLHWIIRDICVLPWPYIHHDKYIFYLLSLNQTNNNTLPYQARFIKCLKYHPLFFFFFKELSYLNLRCQIEGISNKHLRSATLRDAKEQC